MKSETALTSSSPRSARWNGTSIWTGLRSYFCYHSDKVTAKRLDAGQNCIECVADPSYGSTNGRSKGDFVKVNVAARKKLRNLVPFDCSNVCIGWIVYMKVIPHNDPGLLQN